MVDTITVGYELTNTCLKHCGDFTGTNSSNGQSWKIVNGGWIYHRVVWKSYIPNLITLTLVEIKPEYVISSRYFVILV